MIELAKRFYISLLSVILIVSCASDKKNQKNPTSANRPTGPDTGIESTPMGSRPGANTIPDRNDPESAIGPEPLSPNQTHLKGLTDLALDKKRVAGSSLRLLTSKGLDRVYARVFRKRKNGSYGANCDVFEKKQCSNTFFYKSEANDLSSLILDRDVANFRNPDSLTLNYLRSLRTMVYRECSNLVNTEWSALEAGGEAGSHRLVSSMEVPTAKKLEDFLKMILGVRGLEIQIDSGATDYQKAFSKIVQGNKQGVKKTVKDAYIVTCMSLAMDPRVFMY